MKILVTGSSGLIGSEVADYFMQQGHDVIGIDNNMRMEFFGKMGDTTSRHRILVQRHPQFISYGADIRNFRSIAEIMSSRGPFDAIVHCAAQPSHDRARDIPQVDFEVNALGTFNMLEAARENSPNAVFIFMSTNKVYGDAPNEIPLVENPTRYDYNQVMAIDNPGMPWVTLDGINERLRIDRCTHSIFGASKVAADIMTQEYARTYGMKTVVFRGGCLTGVAHAGVELHGFLSYLVKCAVNEIPYKVYGYKGKQVRDNIDSEDVARAIEQVILNPRPGEVYNLGGGRRNSISVIEAIEWAGRIAGKPMNYEILAENRLGDHKCYITDMSKFRSHYPNWSVQWALKDILESMVLVEQDRLTNKD